MVNARARLRFRVWARDRVTVNARSSVRIRARPGAKARDSVSVRFGLVLGR